MAPPLKALLPSNRGHSFEQQGQIDRAIAEWRELLRFEPESIDALVELAETLSRNREYGEAIDTFRLANILAPELPAITDRLNQLIATREALEASPNSGVPTLLLEFPANLSPGEGFVMKGPLPRISPNAQHKSPTR